MFPSALRKENGFVPEALRTCSPGRSANQAVPELSPYSIGGYAMLRSLSFAVTFLLLIAHVPGLDQQASFNSPEQPKMAVHSLPGVGSSNSASGGLCGDMERTAEDRCRSACSSTGSYTFDPGFCGIGAKCTCEASTEAPIEP